MYDWVAAKVASSYNNLTTDDDQYWLQKEHLGAILIMCPQCIMFSNNPILFLNNGGAYEVDAQRLL